MQPSQKQPWSFSRLLAFVVLVGFAVVTLFPFYWMVMTTVMPTGEILSRTPALLPDLTRIDFGAFAAVFDGRPFFTWIINSLIVAFASTFLSLFVSPLAKPGLAASTVYLVLTSWSEFTLHAPSSTARTCRS